MGADEFLAMLEGKTREVPFFLAFNLVKSQCGQSGNIIAKAKCSFLVDQILCSCILRKRIVITVVEF